MNVGLEVKLVFGPTNAKELRDRAAARGVLVDRFVLELVTDTLDTAYREPYLDAAQEARRNRHADLRRLHGFGLDDAAAADALGVSIYTITTDRYALGLPKNRSTS